MPDLILPPKPGDPDRAEDLLDEIQAVLKKRSACLIHKPDCMVLAVADANGGVWRAIAQVQIISGGVGVLVPGKVTWRPIECTEPAKQ